MLENPSNLGETPASIKTQYLLILKVGEVVERLAPSIRKMVMEWMGGEWRNHLWRRCLDAK